MADYTQAGASGADTAAGASGADTLAGGDAGGADTAAGGGAGADTLAGGGAQDPWYSNPLFALEQDDKDYLATKNPASLKDTVANLRSFERQARDRNAVGLPQPERVLEWDGFEKLGLPKDIKNYALKLDGVEGYEPAEWKGLMDVLTPALHGAKVLPQQAELVVKALAKFGHDLKTSLDTASDKAVKDNDLRLRGEWGRDYDKNKALSQRAMAVLGVAEKDQTTLDAILGHAEMIEMFHKIGGMLSEDQMDISKDTAGQLTPDGARGERMRLEADKDFMASLKDPAHRLHQINSKRRSDLIAIESKRSVA